MSTFSILSDMFVCTDRFDLQLCLKRGKLQSFIICFGEIKWYCFRSQDVRAILASPGHTLYGYCGHKSWQRMMMRWSFQHVLIGILVEFCLAPIRKSRDRENWVLFRKDPASILFPKYVLWSLFSQANFCDSQFSRKGSATFIYQTWFCDERFLSKWCHVPIPLD